jgi:hypothetical protein
MLIVRKDKVNKIYTTLNHLWDVMLSLSKHGGEASALAHFV